MSDYIKREDAVFIVLQQPMVSTSAVTEMRQLPSIDIVRCKECVYQEIRLDGTFCERRHEAFRVNTDDFCSYGEREGE